MNNNITIGMELGDQDHVVVAMDANGKEIEMKTIRSSALYPVELRAHKLY